VFTTALNVSISSQPSSGSGTVDIKIEDEQRYQNVQDDANSASVSVQLSEGAVVAPVSPTGDSSPEQQEVVDQNFDANQSQSQLTKQKKELELAQAEREIEAKLSEEIRDLKQRDLEVRQHEQAHASRGGPYTGAPSYDYTQGPDGIRYATSGEVSVDTSPVPGDPEATLKKAQVVRAAALAPQSPSAQDQRVAAEASQLAAQAQIELIQLKREQGTVEADDGTNESEAAQSESQAQAAEQASIANSEENTSDEKGSEEEDQAAKQQEPNQTALERYLEIFGSFDAQGLAESDANQRLVSQFLDALA